MRSVLLRSLLLTCALPALVAGGCRRDPPAGAWSRADLWELEPRVEERRGGAEPAFRAQVGYLGSQEVRDLSRVPPDTFAVYPHQAAGQVRVLEQATGSRLAWRLELGREPYLSFTPLAPDDSPCPACLVRVGVRDGETVSEVLQAAPDVRSPPRVAPAAPPAARVELAAWAGREIELLVQVEGPDGKRLRLASPAVYHRQAVPAVPGSPERPNVLLIGVDTLRADHVGAYRPADAPPWSPPSLTPALDRLAAESDLYLDAYATFNVTNPSFASILTGLYGKNHGVYDLKTPLPPAHTTLAEVFDEAGYDTLAVIAASHLGDHNSGLGQGFDQVVQASEHAAAEMAVETAMDWIAGRGRPFFLWLHLFDPHTPHTPPQPFASGLRPAAPAGLGPVQTWTPFRSPGPVVYEQPVLAGHSDLYAGEVAYLDRQLDRLLAFLESRGLLAGTVVALVSDHGENLGEHGILHRHIGLWETTTRVPMLVRFPGERRSGRRLAGLVQTIDLFPTLLAAAGLPVPASDGVHLAELAGDGRSGRRAAFSEHATRLGLRVRTADYSLMRSAGNLHIANGPHLFALADDPGETRNLAAEAPEVHERLARVLTAWAGEIRDAPAATSRELSQEEIDRLRSLGYLQ